MNKLKNLKEFYNKEVRYFDNKYNPGDKIEGKEWERYCVMEFVRILTKEYMIDAETAGIFTQYTFNKSDSYEDRHKYKRIDAAIIAVVGVQYHPLFIAMEAKSGIVDLGTGYGLNFEGDEGWNFLSIPEEVDVQNALGYCDRHGSRPDVVVVLSRKYCGDYEIYKAQEKTA